MSFERREMAPGLMVNVAFGNLAYVCGSKIWVCHERRHRITYREDRCRPKAANSRCLEHCGHLRECTERNDDANSGVVEKLTMFWRWNLETLCQTEEQRQQLLRRDRHWQSNRDSVPVFCCPLLLFVRL